MPHAIATGVARNYLDAKRDQRRFCITFDTETANEIITLAQKEGTTFSAKVRELVEFGLMDLADK